MGIMLGLVPHRRAAAERAGIGKHCAPSGDDGDHVGQRPVDARAVEVEQADRHQQQIYQYLSHIKILENKYGSETAAVLNTLFGWITGLENTVTAEVERRMDLDKQLTLAETVRDEAKEALADAERRNGILARDIWWIKGERSDALARGARAEEERDQFRNRVHDLEKLVQEIQGKGEGQASLSDDNASLFSNDD